MGRATPVEKKPTAVPRDGPGVGAKEERGSIGPGGTKTKLPCFSVLTIFFKRREENQNPAKGRSFPCAERHPSCYRF